MIRVLYIDDSPHDRDLVRDALVKEHGGFELVEAASRAQFEQKLAEGGYDLVLSDFNIAGFEGLQVIDMVRAQHPGVPVVIVTGTGSEEIGVEAMKRGAADYVIKSPRHIRHLPQTIKSVLEKVRLEEERKRAEEVIKERERQLTTLIGNLPGLVYRCRNDKDWTTEFVSEGVLSITGYPPSDLAERRISLGQLIHPDDQEPAWNIVQLALQEKRPYQLVYRIQTASGEEKWVWEQGQGIFSPAGELLFLEGFVTDITDRKRAEEEITKTTEQLRALSAHLQRIREEERTLIAREIHDELGQSLTALKMDLASLPDLAAKNRAVKEKSGSMSQLVDETIQTVRRIAGELRPGILDDLGLVAALQWQAQEFHRRTGIRCDLVAEIDSISLEKDRATTLFRICQEALTNVTRHAGATQVQITLGRRDHALLLQVRDNGRGFSSGELADPKALGLLGMQERAMSVQGTCDITGEPGKGTVVTVKIPITDSF